MRSFFYQLLGSEFFDLKHYFLINEKKIKNLHFNDIVQLTYFYKFLASLLYHKDADSTCFMLLSCVLSLVMQLSLRLATRLTISRQFSYHIIYQNRYYRRVTTTRFSVTFKRFFPKVHNSRFSFKLVFALLLLKTVRSSSFFLRRFCIKSIEHRNRIGSKPKKLFSLSEKHTTEHNLIQQHSSVSYKLLTTIIKSVCTSP